MQRDLELDYHRGFNFNFLHYLWMKDPFYG